MIYSFLAFGLSQDPGGGDLNGEIAANSDPCSDEPCGDRGECSDLGNGFAYACQCEKGWVDDENYQQPNCKRYDDATCHDSLCEHGGRCPVNEPDNPNCECPRGYGGRWCEHATKGSSKWVGGRLRSEGAKSIVIIVASVVGGIVVVCLCVCCVQCIKKRREAKQTKGAKKFKNRQGSSVRSKKSTNDGDTPIESPMSTENEEQSLLSPQASPRPDQQVPPPESPSSSMPQSSGGISSRGSGRSTNNFPTRGAPALAFQNY